MCSYCMTTVLQHLGPRIRESRTLYRAVILYIVSTCLGVFHCTDWHTTSAGVRHLTCDAVMDIYIQAVA